MDTRMAQILDRLSALPQPSAGTAPHAAGALDTKILELEQQVNDLTQHRLSHLEQMQLQQMEWQVGWLVLPPSEWNW